MMPEEKDNKNHEHLGYTEMFTFYKSASEEQIENMDYLLDNGDFEEVYRLLKVD